jgi:NitT/TauT family transport system permease protein
MSASRDIWLARAAALLVMAGIWQAAAWQLGPTWVPGPAAVGARLGQELLDGTLLVNLAATAQLTVVGTVLGMVAGLAGACVLRVHPRLDRMMQPLINAMMSIPKLGLVPLLVLWFGTGWAPKVGLVALTALFIVFSVTYAGLATIDQRLVMTARVLGGSSLQVTRSVVIPSLWPFVLTGLEVSLPWAVSAALVAEYLSARVGVGHAIEQARQVSDTPGVFAGIIVATVLVLLGNAVLAVLRRFTIKGPVQDSVQ